MIDELHFKFNLGDDIDDGDMSGEDLVMTRNGNELTTLSEVLAALACLNYTIWKKINQDKLAVSKISLGGFFAVLRNTAESAEEINTQKEEDEEISFISFSNPEIREMQKDPVKKGDLIICQNCGKAHPVKFAKDQDGMETNTLAFVHCPENDASYLVAVGGGLLPNVKREEEE